MLAMALRVWFPPGGQCWLAFHQPYFQKYRDFACSYAWLVSDRFTHIREVFFFFSSKKEKMCWILTNANATQFEPWHMITSFVPSQNLLCQRHTILTFWVYAVSSLPSSHIHFILFLYTFSLQFANVHDVSWGTKGDKTVAKTLVTVATKDCWLIGGSYRWEGYRYAV